MKKLYSVYLKYLLLIMLMNACSANNQEEETEEHTDSVVFKLPEGENTPHITYDTFMFNKVNGIKKFKIITTVDTDNYWLYAIRIFSDTSLLQTIDYNEGRDGRDITLIDWNNDGYKDITSIWSSGSAGTGYLIWDYSKKDKKFIFDKLLSDKIGLELDSVKHRIVFNVRGGWFTQYIDTLKYKNNKLELINAIEFKRWHDSLMNTWEKRTVTKIVNGKEVVTIDSSILKKD